MKTYKPLFKIITRCQRCKKLLFFAHELHLDTTFEKDSNNYIFSCKKCFKGYEEYMRHWDAIWEPWDSGKLK